VLYDSSLGTLRQHLKIFDCPENLSHAWSFCCNVSDEEEKNCKTLRPGRMSIDKDDYKTCGEILKKSLKKLKFDLNLEYFNVGRTLT